MTPSDEAQGVFRQNGSLLDQVLALDTIIKEQARKKQLFRKAVSGIKGTYDSLRCDIL